MNRIETASSLVTAAKNRVRAYTPGGKPIPVGTQYGYQDYFISTNPSELIAFASFKDEDGTVFYIGMLRQ